MARPATYSCTDTKSRKSIIDWCRYSKDGFCQTVLPTSEGCELMSRPSVPTQEPENAAATHSERPLLNDYLSRVVQLTIAAAEQRTIENLVHQVERAFANVDHPGDHNLLDHDDKWSRSEIDGFFPIVHWREVSSETLETNHSALCFFSAGAWQFFLPAYLIWTLRSFRESDSFTVDSTIYSLTPERKSDLRQWQLSRFARLNRDQVSVVAAFLEFMRDHTNDLADEEAAAAALDEYWNRFTADSPEREQADD